jgi:hypothetical protein
MAYKAEDLRLIPTEANLEVDAALWRGGRCKKFEIIQKDAQVRRSKCQPCDSFSGQKGKKFDGYHNIRP